MTLVLPLIHKQLGHIAQVTVVTVDKILLLRIIQIIPSGADVNTASCADPDNSIGWHGAIMVGVPI